MMAIVSTTAYALNSYIETYGASKILPYSSVCPNFIQGSSLPTTEAQQIHIIVASTKEIKISATKQFFKNSSNFVNKKITIERVKAASNIAEQPIGLDNAILGARNRIANAKKITPQVTSADISTYYVAIENFFSEPKAGINPSDLAIVVIESPSAKQYTYLSEGVEIDPKIYNLVAAPTNLAKDGTGANSTVGEYLAATYKINDADWFAFVTGKSYSRGQQILTAFKYASRHQ